MNTDIIMLKKFKKYVNNYDINDYAIQFKYDHSIRVMNFAISIVKSLNLPRKTMKLVAISGLLHDYARFEQWKRYHTYSDVKSIDHGDLAVELLFEKNEIKKFHKKSNNYSKIYDTIKYHNKFEVPANITGENLELCNIIRDADKLDIFDILINDDGQFKQDNGEIAKQIENDFFNCKMINYKNIQNANEDTLLKLAMFFDIKYKYSFEYIVNTNIVQRMFDKVQNKEMFKKYFEFVEEYIQRKIAE